jgi:peroxiredoxin
MAELRGLQLRIDDFKRHEAEVLAVVVDPVEQNAEVAEQLELSYRILADPDLRAIDAYDLRHADAGPTGNIARSASFVIDKEGVVRWRDLTQNYRFRPRPEDVVAVLAGLP